MRAFEAVARRLSFSEAADELFVTQSAISRQIKGLEEEIGAALFVRGTRHVEMTQSGQMLLRSVEAGLQKIDASVRQIRQVRSRKRVSVTTFASFGSLWLLPRIEANEAKVVTLTRLRLRTWRIWRTLVSIFCSPEIGRAS